MKRLNIGTAILRRSFPKPHLSTPMKLSFLLRLRRFLSGRGPGPGLQQNTDGIDINIRSGVDDAEQNRRNHDPAYGKDPKHARNFFLAHVSEEKTGMNLVQKVDATSLAQEVTKQLEARGFHAIPPGGKPDIVITVKYGRGLLLSNPYTNSDADKSHTGLSDSDIIGQYSHDKFVGLNERAVRMASEKLIIQVRAWEYPPPKDPMKREKLLWMTTMFVDDPDHRDLNLVADKMLAQGAPYFDRHINREDVVIINTASPEAHVNVGSVEVVKDPHAE